MSWDLPEPLAGHPEAERLRAALQATASAGAALVALRGAAAHGREVGTQLKTAIDQAAEGWVLGFLSARYAADAFLAEERHGDGTWDAPERYWTIDALDGTRSFVEGYPGFCVQVGFVDRTGPLLGVVHEPVADRTYVGARGAGSYARAGDEPWKRLRIAKSAPPPSHPRFVDSTPPAGPVGDVVRRTGGRFVECGSIGLKICRVADGSADIFMKQLVFRLWDVAPGEVIVREAGGAVGTWDGQPIDYASGPVVRSDLLVASPAWFRAAVSFASRDTSRPRP